MVQALRYAETLRPDDVYIEGCLLAQRGASSLFSEWAREMFKDPRTDRDQLPLAHVFSRMRMQQRGEALIIPFRADECLTSVGAGLCHAWHAMPGLPGARLPRQDVFGFEIPGARATWQS